MPLILFQKWNNFEFYFSRRSWSEMIWCALRSENYKMWTNLEKGETCWLPREGDRNDMKYYKKADIAMKAKLTSLSWRIVEPSLPPIIHTCNHHDQHDHHDHDHDQDQDQLTIDHHDHLKGGNLESKSIWWAGSYQIPLIWQIYRQSRFAKHL